MKRLYPGSPWMGEAAASIALARWATDLAQVSLKLVTAPTSDVRAQLQTAVGSLQGAYNALGKVWGQAPLPQLVVPESVWSGVVPHFITVTGEVVAAAMRLAATLRSEENEAAWYERHQSACSGTATAHNRLVAAVGALGRFPDCGWCHHQMRPASERFICTVVTCACNA